MSPPEDRYTVSDDAHVFGMERRHPKRQRYQGAGLVSPSSPFLNGPGSAATFRRPAADARFDHVLGDVPPARPRAAESRLFVLARHAESQANERQVLNSDPAHSMPLTRRGQEQARHLGEQVAGIDIDLAVGTRLLRTRQTIAIALRGRKIPTLIEPDLDEVRAGDLDGLPMEVYWAWRQGHTAADRMPHGESLDDAIRRYAKALRRLLARAERVTLVVTHQAALRRIVLAAGVSLPQITQNAAPYLLDEEALRRAAESLEAADLGTSPVPAPPGITAAPTGPAPSVSNDTPQPGLTRVRPPLLEESG